MTARILQVNFSFSCTPEELGRDFAPLVDPIARTPGMVWKVWLLDAPAKRGGGLYLFERDEDMQAYIASPFIADLGKHPALSDIKVQQFDVLEEFSRATHVELNSRATAAD